MEIAPRTTRNGSVQVIHEVRVGARPVGLGHPVFIIAEAGANHNGDLSSARQLVDVASEARADAVKFQTFKAECLTIRKAPKAAYQLQHTDPAETQFDMLRRLELSPQSHVDLQDRCRQKGILFMSTPFDEQSADFLDERGVAVFKIPSGEITNLPFLHHVSKKKKPLIVSTGMSTLDDIQKAVDAIYAEGNEQLILLHCVSSYPADPSEINLRAMETLQKTFHVPVGFSDHTLGLDVSLAAVALGACVIEKHFTLDRNAPGPDHRMSLTPSELKSLVQGIRTVEAALGKADKQPTPNELKVAAVARKSLVTSRPIPAGTKMSKDMIAIRRPGTGLPPDMLEKIIGRSTLHDLAAETVITWDMLK